jgi:hypothetical protein
MIVRRDLDYKMYISIIFSLLPKKKTITSNQTDEVLKYQYHQ